MKKKLKERKLESKFNLKIKTKALYNHKHLIRECSHPSHVTYKNIKLSYR